MSPRDCLLRYPLFALLPLRQLDAWLGSAEEMRFQTGETIFQEGKPGIWAYVQMEGRVRVLRKGSGRQEVSVGSVAPGEVFGEYALLEPGRNSATCRAASDVRVLRLPLPPMQALLKRIPEVRTQLKRWLGLHGLLQYLRGHAFVGFMSATTALRMLDQLHAEQFSAQCTIQTDGLASDRWHIIDNGQVSLHPTGAADGEDVRALGPGDCFGERALLGQPGLPVAVALSEVHCWYLPRASFLPAPEGGSVNLQTVKPISLTPFTWAGQREEADCGLAALAMIAGHHGRNASAGSLRQRVCLGVRGMNLTELRQIALELDLPCQAVRIGMEQLSQVALPAIAHYRDGHYVTVFAVNPAGIVVGDPATGIVTLSLAEFGQSCSGCLLIFTPIPTRS